MIAVKGDVRRYNVRIVGGATGVVYAASAQTARLSGGLHVLDLSSAQSLSVAPIDAIPAPRRLAVVVDRVGATASLLCAVHCVLLPFVLALLPLIGLEFLAGHLFERIFVACAAALACASLITGYRRHRKPHALYLMVPGILLLVFGIAVDLDAHVVIHTASVVTGGVLVASAHVTNLVLTHRHHQATCATHGRMRAEAVA